MIYLDGVGYKFLVGELNESLKNLKVNKIVAYDKYSFSMFFQKKQVYFENKSEAVLFIKKDKIHNTTFENQFIIKLKKHLISAILKNVKTYNDDRVVIFDFEKINMFGKIEKNKLIFEMLGKSVNVLLIDETKTILATMYYNIGTKRDMAINLKYIYPENQSPYGKYMKDLTENQKEKYSNSYKAIIYDRGLLTYNKFLDENYREFSSLNEAFNIYFYENNNVSILENKKKPLRKYLNNNIKRINKIIEQIPKDIENNSNYNKYREEADILTSNIYLLKQGMKEITLYNYYNNTQINISLDENLSPSKNIQKRYDKYAKAKRREKSLKDRLLELQDELEYYIEQLHFLENEKDIIGVEQIENIFNLKTSKIKANRHTKREMLVENINNFKVYIGRNSYENEKITFEIASPKDIWLHVKDYPGSHVLIKTDNKEVDFETIKKAGYLALKYSKCSQEGLVDYCLRKNIKKISGSNRARVTYKEYSTIKIKEN